MADMNIPDFKPNRPIDIMSMVSALSEKRRAEAQLQQQENDKNQRLFNNIQGAVQSVSNLTQGLIQRSADNQMK